MPLIAVLLELKHATNAQLSCFEQPVQARMVALAFRADSPTDVGIAAFGGVVDGCLAASGPDRAEPDRPQPGGTAEGDAPGG